MARIMLATRNDELRPYLAAKLKRAGHIVTRVADYDSALTLLEEAEYEVLLTTVDTESADELTFARDAQEIDPQMRVMFITGFSAFAINRSERGAGSPSFGRPVHLNRLAEEVSRLTAA